MAVFFDGRCACGRELCDFTCLTYAAYMYMQNNIGACQEHMKKEPITNADRIRAMSVEEMAGVMVGDCPPNYPNSDCCEYEKWDGNLDCQQCWLDWLERTE